MGVTAWELRCGERICWIPPNFIKNGPKLAELRVEVISARLVGWSAGWKTVGGKPTVSPSHSIFDFYT